MPDIHQSLSTNFYPEFSCTIRDEIKYIILYSATLVRMLTRRDIQQLHFSIDLSKTIYWKSFKTCLYIKGTYIRVVKIYTFVTIYLVFCAFENPCILMKSKGPYICKNILTYCRSYQQKLGTPSIIRLG